MSFNASWKSKTKHLVQSPIWSQKVICNPIGAYLQWALNWMQGTHDDWIIREGWAAFFLHLDQSSSSSLWIITSWTTDSRIIKSAVGISKENQPRWMDGTIQWAVGHAGATLFCLDNESQTSPHLFKLRYQNLTNKLFSLFYQERYLPHILVFIFRCLRLVASFYQRAALRAPDPVQ